MRILSPIVAVDNHRQESYHLADLMDTSQPLATQSVSAMSSLPTGTVTFLFTDIEGSTQLWQRFPEAMPAALARHHATLRNAIENHQGHVFQIVGDGFCA